MEQKPIKVMDSLAQTIEEVMGDMCDKYCKYTEIYAAENDADALEEKCESCPLNKLV